MELLVLRLEVFWLCLQHEFIYCVTGSQWRQASSLPLDVLDSDGSAKSEWRNFWIMTIWYGLQVQMSIYQLLRYSAVL